MNKTLTTIVVIALIVSAVSLTLSLTRDTEAPRFGGFTDNTSHQVFYSGITQGGRVVATSTAQTSATLLASDLSTTRGDYTSILRVTPTAGNLTLTLPATSSLSSFVPNAGDRYTLLVENAATAATTTTIAAGTGIDLQEPDGQNVVIGQNNYAVLTFWRESSSDIVVTVDEHIPAD